MREALPPPVVTIGFDPPAVSGRKDSIVWSALQVNNATDLFAAPMRIKYDPKYLQLIEVVPGNALSGDGQKIGVIPDLGAGKGEATVVVSRQPGTAGLNTSGPIVLFRFKALRKGATQVSFPELTLKNSQQKPLPVTAPVLNVNVQ
jgi:hypothetical protein